MGALRRIGPEPSGHDALKRFGVQVVELVAALASCLDQARGFQHGKVLADRLAGQPQTVLGRQPRADLEQGLAIPFRQLIEDAPTGGIGQRLEDIFHHKHTIGK
jgi:hypothetical protein